MTEDPRIIEIEDLDEFLENEARTVAQYNSRLSERQRQITWGSWFVRFYTVNRQTVMAIFAHVEDVDHFRSLEQAAGATDEELEESVKALVASHDDGYLFARHYSTIEPTGEWGSTHRYNCWPIDEPIYRAAANAQWDVSAMTVIQRNRLTAAYDEFRAWVQEQLRLLEEEE